MAKIELTDHELADLVQEVLQRLARDPDAAHLWHWQPRPGCADEPAGPSRRNHLATLLGLLGTAALGSAAGCGSTSGPGTDSQPADGPGPDQPHSCADDPCAGDLGQPGDQQTTKDTATLPDSSRDGPQACGDDPCGCADDPCACADDPCASPQPDAAIPCGDDPCACADDPCACADDPCGGP